MAAKIHSDRHYFETVHDCIQRLRVAHTDWFERDKAKTGEAKAALESLKAFEQLLADASMQTTPGNSCELSGYVDRCQTYLSMSKESCDKCQQLSPHEQASYWRSRLDSACMEFSDSIDVGKKFSTDVGGALCTLRIIGARTLVHSLCQLEECAEHHCLEKKVEHIIHRLADAVVDRICASFKLDDDDVVSSVFQMVDQGTTAAKGLITARLSSGPSTAVSTVAATMSAAQPTQNPFATTTTNVQSAPLDRATFIEKWGPPYVREMTDVFAGKPINPGLRNQVVDKWLNAYGSELAANDSDVVKRAMIREWHKEFMHNLR